MTWSSPTRSSRCCHDSVKPCLAWARSPTIVKLRDGHRASSICHSASVSSCASSTTMCANGPASRSGSVPGSADSSTRLFCASCSRSIIMSFSSESSAAIRSSMTLSRYSRSDARAMSRRCRRRDASGSPMRRRAASRNGRSDAVHARASVRCSASHLVGREPRRARVQVRRHRPQVADDADRIEQRPGPVERRAQRRCSARARGARGGVRLVVVVAVGEDAEQLLPDLVARVVVRGAGLRCGEGLGPVLRE